MSQTGELRRSELNAIIDRVGAQPDLSDGLFTAAQALADSAALRKALSDPSSSPERRQELVRGLFGSRISAAAVDVVSELVALRWSSASSLVAALEQAGVRSEIVAAQSAGQLGDVEDELFRFGRLVQGDPALRDALGDRGAPVELRQQLVSNLLANRATPATLRLAKRAVVASQRTFNLTIDSYLDQIADYQNRSVATVRVARPLEQAQVQRLSDALAAALGRPVTLHVVVDPSVIGGVRIEVGDEVIDDTAAARLDQVRRSLGA